MANIVVNNERIRPILVGLKEGESHTFPIERMKSVRTQASEIAMIYDRQFKTETDRVERTITVKRTM